MKVDTDPEVDSPVALGKMEQFLRAPCILPRMRWMEACGRISRIFSVAVNSNLEVDSPMECHESVQLRQEVHMAVAAGGGFLLCGMAFDLMHRGGSDGHASFCVNRRHGPFREKAPHFTG